MEKEFKIGDRVVKVDDPSDYESSIVPGGSIGIVCTKKEWIMGYVGVEFDKTVTCGHNCNGAARNGHGFYLPYRCLKHTREILSVKQWKQKKK